MELPKIVERCWIADCSHMVITAATAWTSTHDVNRRLATVFCISHTVVNRENACTGKLML